VYRFLLSPRWLGLHVVVLLVIPSFVFLGQWQFGRFEERSANSDLVTTNIEAPPAPLEQVLPGGRGVGADDRYRRVTVTGTYDTAHSVLVRRRPHDTVLGYYVVTPLRTAGGSAVLVNRGWVENGPTADALPVVPAPPTGEVQVTGRLRISETEESSGIKDRPGQPAGQVLLINTAVIGKSLPYPVIDGFVELTEQRPELSPAPAPVEAPDVGAGGGLNLAYGVQWWLFIGVAIGGWLLLIRREVIDRKMAAASGDDPSKVTA